MGDRNMGMVKLCREWLDNSMQYFFVFKDDKRYTIGQLDEVASCDLAFNNRRIESLMFSLGLEPFFIPSKTLSDIRVFVERSIENMLMEFGYEHTYFFLGHLASIYSDIHCAESLEGSLLDRFNELQSDDYQDTCVIESLVSDIVEKILEAIGCANISKGEDFDHYVKYLTFIYDETETDEVLAKKWIAQIRASEEKLRNGRFI